jgi:hypothetical protein
VIRRAILKRPLAKPTFKGERERRKGRIADYIWMMNEEKWKKGRVDTR